MVWPEGKIGGPPHQPLDCEQCNPSVTLTNVSASVGEAELHPKAPEDWDPVLSQISPFVGLHKVRKSHFWCCIEKV